VRAVGKKITTPTSSEALAALLTPYSRPFSLRSRGVIQPKLPRR